MISFVSDKIFLICFVVISFVSDKFSNGMFCMGSNMSTPIILPDSESLIQIKKASRKNYLRAFGQLRKFVGEDFSPPEEEFLQYFKHLRED